MPAKRRTATKKLPSILMALLLVAVYLLEQYGLLEKILPPQAGGSPVAVERAPSQTDSTPQAGILVERVVDGDTLVLADQTKVRLIAVDTPETKHPSKPVEPFGPEASAFTRKAVEGRVVQLRFDRNRYDRYQRTLAYIYVGDWCLNEELIRAGFSECVTQYPFDAAMKQRFLAAESEARRARRGIWSSATQFRLVNSQEEAASAAR